MPLPYARSGMSPGARLIVTTGRYNRVKFRNLRPKARREA